MINVDYDAFITLFDCVLSLGLDTDDANEFVAVSSGIWASESNR